MNDTASCWIQGAAAGQPHLRALLAALPRGEVVLARVAQVQGSGPREVGAWMAVTAWDTINTIGGGRLEWEVTACARALLRGEEERVRQRFALGPSLGQCCGGVVEVDLERLSAADAPRVLQILSTPLTPLSLFGGGHVGRALVQVLAPLPFALRWVDSRDEIFPSTVPEGVVCEHSDPVHGAVADMAPGSAVLIMSFSHAEDLDVVATCLQRQRERGDVGYIGLIGSKTKWATFRHRLEARGFSEAELAQVTCPIGVPGITGKAPEVVAVAVAAQVLQWVSVGAA